MNKIFKALMWVLILISIVILVLTMTNGAVDSLLYWAYAMVGAAVFCVIVVGVIIATVNNPKSLVKLGIGLVAIAAVCFAVYSISAGAPALGLAEQPAASTLKLTDTIINLTYLAGAAALLSIVVGEIVGAIRNK